jgi:hypothetical protein
VSPRPRKPVLVAALAVGLTAAPAAAKEDVVATLTAPVPLKAAPGDELTLAWTLASVDEDGGKQPFDASGVYVTLVSGAGGDPTTGYAEDSHDGRYSAAVEVPEGGIGGLQIALMGWANGEPSPVAFPIANNPLPELAGPVLIPEPAVEAPPAEVPPPEAPASGPDLRWLWLLLAGLLALGAVAILVRRRHQARAA